MKKKLKIALLAPFEESIPPKKYGGTELIVYHLAQELTKRKHKVYLIAAGDSKTKAKLFPIFPKALRTYPKAQNLKSRDALKFIGLGKVLEYLKNIKPDIIHNHIGWRFLPFAHLFKALTVTTLHGPLNIDYQKMVYGSFSNAYYISISNNQRIPFQKLNYIGTVYNGIDVNKFPFSKKKGRYLAFLGRMSPEKGPVQAIHIAKKTKFKFKIAAKVDTVDKEFFEKKVLPLIDGKKIEFLGEVNNKEKLKLLKNAAALLCPIQWREPFGLFFIEAMACGTPVIAFRRGSVPEIIKHGKTGFIVKNIKQAINVVKKIDQIDRKECRKHVKKNFSIEKMVDEYEKLYYKILEKKR